MGRNEDALLVRGEPLKNGKEAEAAVVTARKRGDWNGLTTAEPGPAHQGPVRNQRGGLVFGFSGTAGTGQLPPPGLACWLRNGQLCVMCSLQFLFLCFVWVALVVTLQLKAAGQCEFRGVAEFVRTTCLL